jgi:hypothetical protein
MTARGSVSKQYHPVSQYRQGICVKLSPTSAKIPDGEAQAQRPAIPRGEEFVCGLMIFPIQWPHARGGRETVETIPAKT